MSERKSELVKGMEAYLCRDGATIDDSLKDPYGTVTGVQARAEQRKEPESIKYQEYFKNIISRLKGKVDEYRGFAESGDLNWIIAYCEELIELGDACRHYAEEFRNAIDYYKESSQKLANLYDNYPSRRKEIMPILCRAYYGMGLPACVEKEIALGWIEQVLEIADSDTQFGVSYKKLNILKGILLDDRRKSESILTYELNSANEIFESIGEYNYTDMLMMGKAYIRNAVNKMTDRDGNQTARTYATNGYKIIPSKLIKSIYARDLWRFCPQFTEKALLEDSSVGYHNEVFDDCFSGEETAKAYLAVINFERGRGYSFSSDPYYYTVSYRYSSEILKNHAEEIEDFRKIIGTARLILDNPEKAAVLADSLRELQDYSDNARISNLAKYICYVSDNAKEVAETCEDIENQLEAFDFLETVKNQSVLHHIAMTKSLGQSDWGHDLDFSLDEIDESKLKFRILKGLVWFYKAAETKDKTEKANCFKKAFSYLSELEKAGFDKNSIQEYERYEQVVFANGFVALAELCGNKKCGIGSDTAKAKDIIDNVKNSFSDEKAREYFEGFYSKIKKSLFGGYSFKWIYK